MASGICRTRFLPDAQFPPAFLGQNAAGAFAGLQNFCFAGTKEGTDAFFVHIFVVL